MPKSPLPPAWELPAEIRSRIGETVGRQRAMLAAGQLLLLFHAPPKADEEQRTARLYWRKTDGSWQSSESSGGANTVPRHLDDYKKRLETLDRSLDAATIARDYFSVLSQLSPILRAARNLHKTLQEARELLPGDADLITWRDRAYDIARSAELLYEDAKNGLDFAVALRAEEQATASHRMEVASHRLNMLAAFFFPLATLSAIFGVNLVHGLEDLHPPYTFAAFVGVGVLLGLIFTAFIARPVGKAVVQKRSEHEQRK